MGNNKRKPLLGQVKDAIDFLYDATNKPGGYKGKIYTESSLFGRVSSVLIQRGIISKVRDEVNKRGFTYMWVASMHPTNTLYKSVTQELRDRQRKYDVKSKAKAKAIKASIVTVDTPVVNTLLEEAKNENGLGNYPAQMLWDELKRRGYVIDGERLVKKDYLE